MTSIEQNIIRLLSERGMSQSELARRSGIPKTTMHRYVNGDDIPVSKIRAIADALDVTIDELLGIDVRLSPDERELVECYRASTPRLRVLLLESARVYADGGAAKNNKDSEDVIAI